jgi:hypothetical protein
MRTRGAVRSILLAAAVALMLHATPALAWSNGVHSPNGFGTHDWIMYHAGVWAEKIGVKWMNLGIADSHTDDPDYVINDRVDHNYDRWGGEHFGNADKRVLHFYKAAVSDLRAGRKDRAAADIGLMSHYYADVCEPLHTAESGAETVAVHTAYELTVDSITTSKGSVKSWLHYDGYQRVSDPRKFTQAAAFTAHKSYRKLLSTFRAHGFNRTVRSITATQVNRAANGLLDLIGSIQEDAAERGASPDVGADVGVASDGSAYYAISQNRILKLDGRYRTIAATSGPAADLPGVSVPVLGNGCIVGGLLYVPCTDASTTVSVVVLVFDRNTLQRVAAIPTSLTVAVSALTFDPSAKPHGVFYASMRGNRTSLARLAPGTFALAGARKLKSPVLGEIAGLAYGFGHLVIGTTGGRYGRIFRVDGKGKPQLAYTRDAAAEYDGLAFRGKDLVWLARSGGTARLISLRVP